MVSVEFGGVRDPDFSDHIISQIPDKKDPQPLRGLDIGEHPMVLGGDGISRSSNNFE